jgi:hypothetical protein
MYENTEGLKSIGLNSCVGFLIAEIVQVFFTENLRIPSSLFFVCVVMDDIL